MKSYPKKAVRGDIKKTRYPTEDIQYLLFKKANPTIITLLKKIHVKKLNGNLSVKNEKE